MHAINGTVGDPKFKETDVEVYEFVLTVRIPAGLLDEEGVTSEEYVSAVTEWLLRESEGTDAETGVRGRRLS